MKQINQQNNYQFINLKLPEDLHQKLAILATGTHSSTTEFIIEIINNYVNSQFDNETKLPENQREISPVEYQDISNRLAILESKQIDLEKLENRLVIMEKLMDAIQRQITVRDYAGKLPDHLIDHSHDIDDEPDEILSDFLD